MKQAYDLHHPIAVANSFIALNKKEKQKLALLKLINIDNQTNTLDEIN